MRSYLLLPRRIDWVDLFLQGLLLAANIFVGYCVYLACLVDGEAAALGVIAFLVMATRSRR